MSMITRLVIWGAGTLGGAVGQRWQRGPVLAFTQTTARHHTLQQLGITPHLESPCPHLQYLDVLLLALPGHAHQQAAITALQAAQITPPQRIVMISSTGYYGLNHALINEATPPGDDPRAATIATVEHEFMAWAGKNGVILRSGGLYGLGRGPIHALARRGYPKAGPPNKTLALIHYLDLAAAVIAALQHPQPAPVYLAVTPPCPTREEFYTLACDQLNLPAPVFTPVITNPPLFYDVTLLRQELHPHPLYPHWQTALAL